jgi:hypothetical protein
MSTPVRRFSKIILLVANAISLFVAMPVYAAQFSVEVPGGAIGPHSEVTASVYLNTEGQNINAIDGALLVPSNFDVISIDDGGSVVPMWVQAPAVIANGQIEFSGITPGGYNGDRGFIFSAVIRANTEGDSSLSLSNLQALLNDGQGTSAKVATTAAKVAVSSGAQSTTTSLSTDTTPPEPFALQIVQTPDAFDGKKVLLFATQDKGSGLSHYEVCEGLLGSCVTGKSAYILSRQAADGLITVIAFDNAGNSRVERLFTSSAIFWYSLYLILAILIGVGVGAGLFNRRRH